MGDKLISDGKNILQVANYAKDIAYPLDDTYTELADDIEDLQDSVDTINSNLMYSSTKINTGKKWNGKTVYRQTFSANIPSNNIQSNNYIDFGTTVDNVLYFNGTVKRVDSSSILIYSVPNTHDTTMGWNILTLIHPTRLQIRFGSIFPTTDTYSIIFTMEFTEQ